MSATQTTLWTLTGSQLSAGYSSGAFTPVEVLKSVLARLDEVNPRLNAVVTIDREAAGKAAVASQERHRLKSGRGEFDGILSQSRTASSSAA
jgi:aspartyl-tRNA(Asn)/glutamyl-tRNA(Gln) amidotransferase subunit A